jgi:hypothetical protein
MSDGSRSRSRSASRASSRSHSPASSRGRSRTPSIAEEEEAYAMSQGQDARAPQAPLGELEFDEEDSRRHRDYFDSRKPKSGWKKLLSRR